MSIQIKNILLFNIYIYIICRYFSFKLKEYDHELSTEGSFAIKTYTTNPKNEIFGLV